jgi:lysophospholipase L1-like esterase
MKRFLLKVAVYAVVLIFILCILVLFTHEGLRRSEFGNLKEWREILNGDVNAELLIQGSSRAWVQFDTQLIDSLLGCDSYNLGMDGAPFDVQYVRWKAYLANNTPPRVVIQNVDYELFDPNERVFQKYQYLPFLSDKQFVNILTEHQLLDVADRWLPFSVYMGQPQAIRIAAEALLGINRYKSTKHKGFKANDAQWDGTNLEIQKQGDKFISKRDKQLVELFIRFINECKAMNIRLVMVYAPVYHELGEVIANLDHTVEFFQELANDYHLEYYDFSSTDLSYSKENFYNATHLNTNGAQEFSRRLSLVLQAEKCADQLMKVQL